MIPESQADFRKGRSTIDNIFVLNHVMQRKIRQEMEMVRFTCCCLWIWRLFLILWIETSC